MTVREFLAHTTPGKTRVFAVDTDHPQSLEAVTSLAAEDSHRTDSLLDGLNVYLLTRDEDDLDEVLAGFPEAVSTGVRDYLARRSPTQPLGAFSPEGPIAQVQLARFLDEEELREHVTAAYVVALGVRMSNEVDERGTFGWEVELLNTDAYAPEGAEPRTWALPESVPLLSTWTSRLAKGDPIETALDVALDAGADGHWVRLHTFDGSDVRVDVFDVPVPVGERE